MDKEYKCLNAQQLGKIIDLFSPCMDDYLYVYDFKEDYFQISPDAARRFLLPSSKFHGFSNSFNQYVAPEDIAELVEEMELVMKGKKEFHDMHYRWLDRRKEPVWINCRGRVIRDQSGIPHYLVGCVNEIGAKQKADNVSGLLGESSLKTYYESFQGKIPSGFLLRIGIDDFKDINENLGIEYGDFILRRTAECIGSDILPGELLFRIVADEFVILDVKGGSLSVAQQLYKKICGTIFSFIEEDKYHAVYTVSGGILMLDEPGRSYPNLMKLSEFALSEAKRCGKNSCVEFNQEDYAAYLVKKELTRVLHHAVNHDFQGFEAYFQPLVCASDYHLTGAEALLRFKKPDKELVPPMEFIPILEETGLIIPVGKWILRQALLVCKECQKHIPGFKVNVNLSYVQVLKSRVYHEITELVKEYGVAPGSICIELTESGYLEENPHFSSLWNGLKEFGVLLALDDFGTGYSNLNCLCDLKPAIVKIDHNFTAKALNRSFEYDLLIQIIKMSHSLGLSVCVEGIETEQDLDKMAGPGPDYIQGYLFGRPCTREEFYHTFLLTAKEKPLL